MELRAPDLSFYHPMDKYYLDVFFDYEWDEDVEYDFDDLMTEIEETHDNENTIFIAECFVDNLIEDLLAEGFTKNVD